MLFFFLLLLPFASLQAQKEMIYKGDTVNRLDERGEKHEKWVKTYPESERIRYIGTFEHGTPVDTFRHYYKNKNPKAVKVFSRNGRETETRIFHSNGKIMAEGIYVDRKKEGEWRFFDPSGTLSSIETYDGDQLSGKKVVCYRNGDTAKVEHYRDSTLHGPWRSYFQDGTLKGKGRFENGDRKGVEKRYHPNGELKVKGGHDENGFRDGEWTYYDEDGEVEHRAIYDGAEIEKILGPDGEVISDGPPLDTTAPKPIDQQNDGPRLKREDRTGEGDPNRRKWQRKEGSRRGPYPPAP